jgi:hypothetical protein
MGNTDLNINFWNNKFKISAESDLNIDIDENTILELLGDNNNSFNSIVFGSLDYNTIDKNTSIIESYLKNEKDKNNSIISDYKIDTNKTEIKFNEDMNYTKYLVLYNYLNNNLNSNFLTNTPVRKYTITQELNDINSELIKNKLSELNIITKEITKEAEINTMNITIKNQEYTYDKNTTNWLKYPEDINKTSINFAVNGYTTRNKLMFLTLDEN